MSANKTDENNKRLCPYEAQVPMEKGRETDVKLLTTMDRVAGGGRAVEG